MSVINKKPIIEEILEGLSVDNKEKLKNIIDSPVEDYSLLDESNHIFNIYKMTPVVIQRLDNSLLTGVLIIVNEKLAYFLAFYKNSEYLGVFYINLFKNNKNGLTYWNGLNEIKDQNLSISELRMYFINGAKVDQTYDPLSKNAQSGIAIAEALQDLIPEMPKFIISNTEESGTCSGIPSVIQVNKAHAVYITDNTHNITLLRIDSTYFEHAEFYKDTKSIIVRKLNGTTGEYEYSANEQLTSDSFDSSLFSVNGEGKITLSNIYNSEGILSIIDDSQSVGIALISEDKGLMVATDSGLVASFNLNKISVESDNIGIKTNKIVVNDGLEDFALLNKVDDTKQLVVKGNITATNKLVCSKVATNEITDVYESYGYNIKFDAKGIHINNTMINDDDIVNKKYVDDSNNSLSAKIDTKQDKGNYATLDESGKVPESQLPSYVDDVLEFSSKSSFPTTGETGKIYVATDANLTYRWSGTTYIEISQSLALGETSSTAYAGDKGKKNAEDIASLITSLGETNDSLDETNTNLLTLANSTTERIDEVNRNLSNGLVRITQNETDIASLKTETETLDKGIENLGETINKNYDSLNERITANETNIITNENAINALDTRVGNVETKATTNANNIDTLTNRVSVAESDISNIINTELPKVATDIAYNDGFVLQDKNGNDLTFKTPIKLGDNLTYDSGTNKINATSSGKLYLHHITLENNSDNPSYAVINSLGALEDLHISFDVINNSSSNVSINDISGVNINGYLYDNNDVLYQAIGFDGTNFKAITSKGVILNKSSIVFKYIMQFCVKSEIITEL